MPRIRSLQAVKCEDPCACCPPGPADSAASETNSELTQEEQTDWLAALLEHGLPALDGFEVSTPRVQLPVRVQQRAHS